MPYIRSFPWLPYPPLIVKGEQSDLPGEEIIPGRSHPAQFVVIIESILSKKSFTGIAPEVFIATQCIQVIIICVTRQCRTACSHSKAERTTQRNVQGQR